MCMVVLSMIVVAQYPHRLDKSAGGSGIVTVSGAEQTLKIPGQGRVDAIKTVAQLGEQAGVGGAIQQGHAAVAAESPHGRHTPILFSIPHYPQHIYI